MKTIIAVDPGASGGIAWRDGKCGRVSAVAMPETRGDVIVLFRQTLGLNGDWADHAVAYHEKINGFIPDGGPSMMFTFGANCERVGCILETLGVRIVEVTPQAWQKDLHLGTKGLRKVPSPPKELKGDAKRQWQKENEEAIASAKAFNANAKKEWKNKLKADCQRRFPGAPVTLRTCDALLLLDYAIKAEGAPKDQDLFG